MMKKVVVNDRMQKNDVYFLTGPVGINFHPVFKPELTPREMLEMGIFGGKSMTDCTKEFPKNWFAKTKLCHEFHDPALNYFGLNASRPLS